MPWDTYARVITKTSTHVEFQIPGGWSLDQIAIEELPDWLQDVKLGQTVICVAQSNAEFDKVILSNWKEILPIGLRPNPFDLNEEFLALPEAKLEFWDDIIYGDPGTRAAMFAALLSNMGLHEAVTFAAKELWLEALYG